MKLSYGLTIEQTQKLTMTPELIQAIRILQFNTQELDNFVQGELLENPVLEYDRTADIEPPKEKPDFDLREKIKEDYNKIIYPEELLDKKCAGCVRCEKRNSYGRKKIWLSLYDAKL